MLDISRWSFARVALAAALWVALNFVLVVVVVYLWFRAAQSTVQSTGSGGIGALVVTLPDLALIVLYLFVPPIVLTLYWLFVRRS